LSVNHTVKIDRKHLKNCSRSIWHRANNCERSDDHQTHWLRSRSLNRQPGNAGKFSGDHETSRALQRTGPSDYPP
jgi:hypothetical protein